MKKISLLLPMLLLLTMLSFPVSSSETVTMFVNDTPWSDEIRYGKAKIDGIYYVPTSVFEAIDGLEVSSNTRYANVMLTYNGRYITFNTDNRTIAYTEENGAIYLVTYMIRSGTLWVPAEAIAVYFGLTYEQITHDGIDVIRIRDGNASRTIGELDAAYNGNGGQQQGGTPVVVDPEPPVVPADCTVRLTFADVDAASAAETAALLDEYGVKGLFYFDASAVADSASVIRSLIVSGHSVGLQTSETDAEGASAALASGNAMLDDLFHSSTRFVRLAADCAPETVSRVTSGGYLIRGGTAVKNDASRSAVREAERAIAEDDDVTLIFRPSEELPETLSVLLEDLFAQPSCTVVPVSAADGGTEAAAE